MALIRFRTFRRFALAFATAQVVAYASVPMIEAATEHPPGPAAVAPAHSLGRIHLHHASNCLACQLLTAHARLAESARVVVPVVERPAAIHADEAPLASRPPPHTRNTRAPPFALA